MLKKAQVEEIFPVLVAARIHGPVALLLLAKHLLAGSALDTFELEKRLPSEVVDEILKRRIQMGTLQAEFISLTIEKQIQRFRKALDSDDVELVCLLLKERQLSLDDAYALHYAASYCDPHTLQELLELGCADVNLRDNRGLTVLHLAAMRREPVILAGLLSKGANPLELTPDGRTAVQLCKRQIKSLDYSNNVEDSEELQENRLSVEILDQASRQHPYANVVFTPVADEKELLIRLLYLENREGQGAHEIPVSSEPSAQELRQDTKKHSTSSEPTIEGLLPITSSGDVGAEVPFLRIQENNGKGYLRPSHGEEDNHIGRNDGRGAANIDLHVPVFGLNSHIPARDKWHALHSLQDASDLNNGQAIKASTVGCLLPLSGEEETDADGQDSGTPDAFSTQLKCLTRLDEEKHLSSEREQQEADEVGFLSSIVKSLLKYAEFWAEDPGKGFHAGIAFVAYLIWKIDVLNAYDHALPHLV
ncbi:hypothetical protein L7F22_012156 [Adiantum nelumboides]|nr:hypothetical protein [Adiantum nelumboides]